MSQYESYMIIIAIYTHRDGAFVTSHVVKEYECRFFVISKECPAASQGAYCKLEKLKAAYQGRHRHFSEDMGEAI